MVLRVSCQSGTPAPHGHSLEPACARARFQGKQLATTRPSALLTAAPVKPVPERCDRAEPERPWFEKEMSSPPVPFHPQPDPDINDRLQDPAKSLDFYHREVERRRQAKEAGEVYTFAPLMHTLANMRDLTQHILANRQFEQPLSAEDRAAFCTLGEHIETHLTRQAPYESTVQLAVMMTCMLEVATARYALPDLEKRVPALFHYDRRDIQCLRLRQFAFVQHTADERFIPLPSGDIALSSIVSCAFGGINPGGQDEKTQLFGHWFAGKTWLTEWLRNDRLFLYPSFEPLTPKDLAHLGHLPIYPLGMTSAYALNADGFLHTPLRFLDHDLGHAYDTAIWEHLRGSRPLQATLSRLQFRQLVMDRLPAALKAFDLDTALALVVFNLFHEYNAFQARRFLEPDSFLPLFNEICRVRRERACDYSPEYQKVDDLQALIACLWVHRAYHCWCQHSGEARARIAQTLADRFLRHELPALLECWAFLEKHREALLEHFLDFAALEADDNGHSGLPVRYKSKSRWARYYNNKALTVSQERNRHTGGPVEQVDLPFFDALQTPRERELIKKAVNEWPPANGSDL